MAVSPEFQEHLLELLEPLGRVSSRRMFGGADLFKSGLMFALVADEVLYLKADDSYRTDFRHVVSGPFSMKRDRKRALMSYWRAPDHLLEDGD